MLRWSVYRDVIWLILTLSSCVTGDGTRESGTYLYRSTCFATGGGTTEDSRYLIDNILKMGVCQQSLADVYAGTSQIYTCVNSGTDILLTAKRYSRTDCAVSHELREDGVLPEPWSDFTLSSECRGATGQQSLWRCERNPSFISSKDWFGVVLYQNTTTPTPEDCPVLSTPTVYAFSGGCVALGGGGGARYVNKANSSDFNKVLLYTEYVDSDCSGVPITDETVTGNVEAEVCKNVSIIPGRPFSEDLFDGYGYISSPLNDSWFAQNNVGVGPDANPPVDVLAIALTLVGAICLCFICVCFLFYFMKKKTLKATLDDELEKEEMRQKRKKKREREESDTEAGSIYGGSFDYDYTENPLLSIGGGRRKSAMQDEGVEGIEMINEPMTLQRSSVDASIKGEEFII
jgi:hypothetical protein